MYTPEQTEICLSKYKANPSPETIAILCDELGKSKRSVIAKLTKAGLYSRKPYVSKTGEPPRTKESIATEIGELVQLQDFETDSLTKASKSCLLKILKFLKD